MGPSGSSKTTFLNAISGRIQRQNVQGSVLVNGKPVDSSFFKVSQYVQQDDALFAMLTVAETLMFSARFRLPGSMSYGDKLKRVEAVIQQLGLSQCANTYVGNAQVKGVSGGERRRVSIGVELIHDPAVVFLDEPTSGLDSTSALHLMKTLSGLAVGRKRLVILTIHQPSFRILELIDQTLLLARGNVVYHGTVPQMTNFFQSIGHNVTGNVNIVEFALDTIQRIQDDALSFEKVTAHQKESHEMQGFERTNSLSRDKTEQLQTPAYASSFLSQTLTLAQRTAKPILRTPELFWSRLALAVATAIACGTIFLNVDQAEKGAQQRQVFLLFTVALMMYTTNESLPTFLAERPVLVREVLGGAYKPLAYTLAQVLVFMPFLSLIALLNVSLAYFMVGLVHNAGAFFIFVLTLVLALLLANSFLAVFGAISPTFLVANASFTAVFTMMLIFSGFFIPRSYIPNYWIWLHYLSIVKYPYEILIWNEFSQFPNKIWFGTVTTEDLLSNLSLGEVHIWSNMAVMVGMIIG